MDQNDDKAQTEEITVLQSIYGDDYIPCPPPKAWKGASAFREFIIRVTHPDIDHASKINLRLRVKFPKTYPRLACPTFTIEKPIVGINQSQIAKLSQEVNAEAQKRRGFEMVFTIVTYVQDWMEANVTPVVGSLAVQMNQRAMDEEKARKQREQEEAARASSLAAQAAQELDEQIQAEDAARQKRIQDQEDAQRRQIQADAIRQKQIQEDAMRQFQMFGFVGKPGAGVGKVGKGKSRKRANSETTEVPDVDSDVGMDDDQLSDVGGISRHGQRDTTLSYGGGMGGMGGMGGGMSGIGAGGIASGTYDLGFGAEVFIETFPEMEINGVRFCSVKLYQPKRAPLGVTYSAEPIVDDPFPTSTVPLELFCVTFESHYYRTSQGRKKLGQVEAEIRQLIGVRHPKLASVFGVKLNFPGHQGGTGSGYGSGGYGSSSSTVGTGGGIGSGVGSAGAGGWDGEPRLVVLYEQTPALTLHDVLEDCESLREDRAQDYIGQVLAALNALHLSNLVHRSITPRCIGLTTIAKDSSGPSNQNQSSRSGYNNGSGGLGYQSYSHQSRLSLTSSQPKVVKLCRAGFYTRLLDLHRSNSFGPNTPLVGISGSGRNLGAAGSLDDITGSASQRRRRSLSINPNAPDDGSDFDFVSNSFGVGGGGGGGGFDSSIPEGWLSRDVQNESSLLYTRQRDIHEVGIVLLQMVLGLDVLERFPDPQSAIRSSAISPALARQALMMIEAPKKTTISYLLSDFNNFNNDIHSSSSSTASGLGGNGNDPHGHNGSKANGHNAFGQTALATPTTARMGSMMMGPPTARIGGGMNRMSIGSSQAWTDPATPTPFPYGSPEAQDYFRMQAPAMKKTTSRWKEDWEELELLGKGAFGSVVKAKNMIDGRIYAVKKVRLRTQSEKIFREVNALSRLSHRNIVRYYTTWLENDDWDLQSTASSEEDSELGSTAGGMTSVPDDFGGYGGGHHGNDRGPPTPRMPGSSSAVAIAVKSPRHPPINGGFHINIDDFDDLSSSRASFPSIHFGGSQGSDDEDEDEGDGGSEGSDDDDDSDDDSSGPETKGGKSSEEESEEDDSTEDDATTDSGPGTDSEASTSSGDIEFALPDGSTGGAANGFGSLFQVPSSSRNKNLDGKRIVKSIHSGRSGKSKKSLKRKKSVGAKGMLSASMLALSTPGVAVHRRTLYIQMEFVERQTLRERVDEGISEEEAWRLFQQILDALVHMSTLGILHRDIKLTNIFIDANGDFGDFGLATSSLAAVDTSTLAVKNAVLEPDMTLEVGTRLYIAPEVQSRRRARGPRDQSKADMYSLGIVFFEMNFKFGTGAERVAVLDDLRRPAIIFPPGWDPQRKRQRDIITWLLQHEPQKRPTAYELSQSNLLPGSVDHEFFKGALRLMAKPESQHHQIVLATLFAQPPRQSRAFLYDSEAEQPEYAVLNDTVQDRLAKIFHLHGAVDSEPPLLMPIIDIEEERTQATFLDPHGDIVALPNNIVSPLARLAAKGSTKRIKRYHIMNVFRPNPVAGHPKFGKAALFDIISPDLELGPIAAGAEILSVANDILDSFPNLSQNYEIHISHTKIAEIMMARVPADARSAVMETIHLPKSTPAQKRALLTKKNLLRTTIDEIELLAEVSKDIDDMMSRMERISPAMASLIAPAVKEITTTIQFAQAAGVSRPMHFHPLMFGGQNNTFKDGVLVEVVRRNKYSDVLATGGHYEHLIRRFQSMKSATEPVCAMGIQITIEKITAALAQYQSASLKTLVKQEHSFGFWSPRRCDVYVVSYQAGYLQDRLEVASYLWKHNISADLMYETGLPDAEHENHLDICHREGILFTVYPRPRTGRNLPAFKVKSILKGTEVDLTKSELVPWLHQAIAEQKRIDATTSGAPNILSEGVLDVPAVKENTVLPDVQLVLPDSKKKGKQVKQIFSDKAFERAKVVKSAFSSNMPVIAVDVTQAHFEAMIRSPSWITDEEAWKSMTTAFPNPPQYPGYNYSIREAVQKRKSEGHSYVLLFAVREDRAQLLFLG